MGRREASVPFPGAGEEARGARQGSPPPQSEPCTDGSLWGPGSASLGGHTGDGGQGRAGDTVVHIFRLCNKTAQLYQGQQLPPGGSCAPGAETERGWAEQSWHSLGREAEMLLNILQRTGHVARLSGHRAKVDIPSMKTSGTFLLH